MAEYVPFNKPYMSGRELEYIAQAHANSKLAGDGPFTDRCHDWLEKDTGARRALLTHSCTAALEMSAILADVGPGDEVIMPSFTFVSTANAFALRGAKPVFVDIREDTLNIDESLIESAITARTRAIVPVHYAGVSCEMERICEIAAKHELLVIEDAAQGVLSSYRGSRLGSIGHLGCLSFHETKNVISGEGGALLVNSSDMVDRAEIVREKGTDRSQFLRGAVDKYTWQDIGSSYLPGELTAAFLASQLEDAHEITKGRRAAWDLYHEMLQPLEEAQLLRRPVIPADCEHNGHLYYVLLAEHFNRNAVLESLNSNGVNAIFHYVPLHSAPAGSKFGKAHGGMRVTEKQSSRLVRLPLWFGIGEADQNMVVDQVRKILTAS